MSRLRWTVCGTAQSSPRSLLAAERRSNEALTLALRALTAGVPPAPAATIEAPEQEQDTAPAKRRGWQAWLRGE